MHKTLLAFLTTLAASAALAAGQVEVSFRPADQLADVGRGIDRERNLKTLSEHFKSLGARLPDGQVLKIEVLDVNLAGELRPTRRGDEVRVLAGAADWPTLDLRWSLLGGGQSLKSGQERLADMAYLNHAPRAGDSRTLPHEARLIDRWFIERVLGAAKPAP